MKHHVIGIDFGTLSARALLLDTENGNEVASAVMHYPSAVLDRRLADGTPLKDKSALQDPRDYLTALAHVIPEVLKTAGLTPDDIAGLGIDFTTCTLLPIKEDGTPLREDPAFGSNPHAFVKLWKHHAAQAQADRITALAVERGEPWLPLYGGRMSSEWLLPKVLEILEDAPEVFDAADRFLEAADWLSLLLTGKETHNPGMACLKANYAPGIGFPTREFLATLDPRLCDLYGTKVSAKVDRLGTPAGTLTKQGAALTGLPEGTPLALPVLDAGSAMPALGITGEGELLMIIGTSGVLMLNSRDLISVPGICGCMEEPLIPGYYTYEAGLASLGDTFDWFVKRCVPADYKKAAEDEGISIHRYLRERAMRLKVGQSGLLALDWLGGNRSVLSDADLTGMILGLNLATTPEEIYRALIEATAFGMRRAMEAYTDVGARIHTIFAAGGIARKDEMLMQIYADVTGRQIRIAQTAEAAARGAAIYASQAAGIYRTVDDAIRALASPVFRIYTPIPENVAAYEGLYAEYKRLHDYFGCGENPIMKTLSALRKQ